MSTRALYTFQDGVEQYHVYKHHDGYPSGALGFIAAATKLAWPLPRFEPDEFAAAFVAANKESAGGVRLTMGATWTDSAPADIEYHYVITQKFGKLHIECYSADCMNEPTQELLQADYLPAMLAWSEKAEA